ncbi:hypothetical protein Golax_020539, partial [Gossypium laxum]|nr:hypothetical protein [Gossypium laxum]
MENALANLHIDDVKQFGDFVGSFVAYDAKSIANGVSSYINFRVREDVWHLLKRRKKIVLSQSKQVIRSGKGWISGWAEWIPAE